MSKPTSSISFLDGHSPRKNALGILTFPHMLESRTRFCRFYTFVDGNWGTTDLNYQGKSITSLIEGDYRAWCILGKNGEISEMTGTSIKHYKINGISSFESIKNINGTLYACGYHRQVYMRKKIKKWISISSEIHSDKVGIGFLDIDGFSDNNIYAVGFDGEIYFYDGIKWQKDNLMINNILSKICCLPNGEVVICGYNGVVIRGSFNNWTILNNSSTNKNWYSVQYHNDSIYLAGDSLLCKLDGSEIVKVVLPREYITTHRLHSCGGLLWSIGEDDIFYLEDNIWKEVIHPDNC